MATFKNNDPIPMQVPIVASTFPIEVPTIVATVIPDYGSASAPPAETFPFNEDVATTEATPLVFTDDGAPGHIYKDTQSYDGPAFRDVPFAVLFFIQITVMIWLGTYVAPAGFETIQFNLTTIEAEAEAAMRQGSDDVTDADVQHFEQAVTVFAEFVQVYPFRILFYLILPCCILAFIFAYFMTAFVIKPCPKPLVYACLAGSVISTAAVMIASSIASRQPVIYLMTAVSLGAVLYYVGLAWRMVPFVAVNLKVALAGISRNCGMYVVACLFAELGFCWVLYWLYVVVGVSVYQNDECQKAHPELDFQDYADVCGPPFPVGLLFLLSLYWTSTALMNAMQVTVVGVMATWCFDKDEADGCCSSAVFNSLSRSLTYSFGSICFGSLLQGLVSVLRYAVESARARRENNECCCGCGSLLFCIQDALEYFNQWAYVFVGVYGYGYLESGKRVMELFRARGWTSIITNRLVSYVLGFATFVIGVLTGCAALIVEHLVTQNLNDPTSDYNSYLFGPLPGWKFMAFGVGFFIGVWIASVMMNVIKGAVNTLIVCWADSPEVFEMNHPTHTKEMVDSWRSAFPEATVQLTPAYIPAPV